MTVSFRYKRVQYKEGGYLWRGSEVDNAIQLDVLAKLVVQPPMPVLVDGPFGLIQAFTLI